MEISLNVFSQEPNRHNKVERPDHGCNPRVVIRIISENEADQNVCNGDETQHSERNPRLQRTFVMVSILVTSILENK